MQATVASCSLAPAPCRRIAFKQAVSGSALQLSRRQQHVRQQRAGSLVCKAELDKETLREDAVEVEEQQDFAAWEQDDRDVFQERVVQVRRVTKVVKGGKKLSFRAVVIVGDENGTVGVGCDSAGEVVQAVKKAVVNAKRNLVTVPLNKNKSFPHRFDGTFGAAKVMLRPAAEGTGVIAGGAVRAVLELAGVKNAFGKQLGTDNPLNNARACLDGLRNMRTFQQVAEIRGIPVEKLMGTSA